MNKYMTPMAEEVKFLAVNVIMASVDETPETTTATTAAGPAIPGQGGDVEVPSIGGN